MSTQNLQLHTKKELGEIAKARGIKISQSWLKADIISAIEVGKAVEAPAPSTIRRRGEY